MIFINWETWSSLKKHKFIASTQVHRRNVLIVKIFFMLNITCVQSLHLEKTWLKTNSSMQFVYFFIFYDHAAKTLCFDNNLSASFSITSEQIFGCYMYQYFVRVHSNKEIFCITNLKKTDRYVPVPANICHHACNSVNGDIKDGRISNRHCLQDNNNS